MEKLMLTLSYHYFNLIENTAYENLEKLNELGKNKNGSDKVGSLNKQTSNTIRYQRNDMSESIQFVAILVDKLPNFVSDDSSGATFKDDFR
jgi:hypothetical protein